MPECYESLKFNIDFSADGKIKSIIRLQDGTQCIKTVNKDDGFTLVMDNNIIIPLDVVEFENNILKFSSAKSHIYIDFRVVKREKYCVFSVEKASGLSNYHRYSLEFKADTNEFVKAVALDYMTFVPHNQKGISVSFNNFYYLTDIHPKGAFALYTLDSYDDEDDTLLRIWTTESVAHPKVDGAWDYDRAKKWIEDWKIMFKDRTRMFVSASNEEELYEVAEVACKNGIKEIYLHTDVWRFEYWPYKNHITHINRDVFPNGEKDLKRFTDYLAQFDAHCVIHNVCGGIGFNDKKYVIGENGVDSRLASWTKGVLESDISENQDTVYYIPSEDKVEIPFVEHGGSNRIGKVDNRPAYQHCFDGNLICIGNELAEVERITEKGDILEIKISKRGQYETVVSSHKSGERVIGLLRTYGMNLLPDNDSDLIVEQAKSYAEMLNATGVASAEYDGAEIHCYNGSYGYYRFAEALYSNLDHPVIAHDSGGLYPQCHFEYLFNSVRKSFFGEYRVIGTNGGEGAVSLLLNHIGRDATIPTETSLCMNIAFLQGVNCFGVQKPEPMFGVSSYMMKTYGLSDELLKAASLWKQISDNADDEVRSIISRDFKEAPTRFASHEPATKTIYMASQEEDGVELTPIRTMTDENTINWQKGVEHGCLYPAQYLKDGEKITLCSNASSEQMPEFYIKVKAAFDYQNERNKNLLPSLEDVVNIGDYDIKSVDDGLQISYNNLSSTDYWETNNHPAAKVLLSMKKRRGIGIRIVGDGSNSVFLVKIPGGDYPIKIDFIGERYIEIPDAQYAWRQNYWGWRMNTKHTNYLVNYISFGFGYIPTGKNASVTVKEIIALKEIKTSITNPVIKTDSGCLRVNGDIKTDEILYFNGKNVSIRDKNWKLLCYPQYEEEKFIVKPGDNNISIESSSNVKASLEIQVVTKEKPFKIKC